MPAAANAMEDTSEPAAIPAPADTRNERRLNIFYPSSVLDAGVQAITPWRVKPPYVCADPCVASCTGTFGETLAQLRRMFGGLLSTATTSVGNFA